MKNRKNKINYLISSTNILGKSYIAIIIITAFLLILGFGIVIGSDIVASQSPIDYLTLNASAFVVPVIFFCFVRVINYIWRNK